MYTFLVAYDLRSDWSDEHYSRVSDAIRSCGTAVEAERSVWFLQSRHLAKEVQRILAEELDGSDRILVIEVKRHWALRNLMDGARDLLP